MNSRPAEQIIKLKQEIKAKADEGVELSRQIRQAKNAKEIYELSQDIERVAEEMKHLKAMLAGTTAAGKYPFVGVGISE